MSTSETIAKKKCMPRRLLIMPLLGFSSGLPLLAIGGTLQAWLTESGVSLGAIGLYSVVGLPYALKFLWAPALDRYTLNRLGRRRSWMIVSQLILLVILAILGVLDPQHHPILLAGMALLIAVVSATQDIALDAHRRDILTDPELGLGSALFVGGYRLGMLVSGALALWLADQGLTWSQIYLIVSSGMLVGLVATLLAPEPPSSNTPQTLCQAVAQPLKVFIARSGAAWVILFAILYKLGDTLAGAMTIPFLLDIGYTKSALAMVAKTFGLIATITGGLAGGLMLLRCSLRRALMLFGLLQLLSTAGFILLAKHAADIPLLTMVIAFENFSSGLGTAAFLALLAQATDRRYSATQFAILTSLTSLPRTLFAAGTGFLATVLGWVGFFALCTLSALPGLLLITLVTPNSTTIDTPE